MGNDPPGQFTRVLHPRVGRHGDPPPEVIPIGRSVIVPANGSLPNIILRPRSFFRIRRVLERERFDVLHLHEPMTPTPCIAALALCDDADGRDAPRLAATSAGCGWRARSGASSTTGSTGGSRSPSRRARRSSAGSPASTRSIPNGVLIPESASAGDREHRVVFAGRQEPRKGLQVLLRAWPEIRRRTGPGSRSPAPTRSPCGCC